MLGCFAARNLMRYNLRVALLEKREDLCTGISRANTAIIYSGCDTKPGTLKTSLCLKSAQGFSQLCADLGVRYSSCGSIMVSFGERGDGVLQKKLEQGIENGVRGMKLLTREEVLELEPNIAGNVHAGLYVPDTGTVMPWELGLAAAENAVSNGADVLLNTEVTGVAGAGRPSGKWKVESGKLGTGDTGLFVSGECEVENGELGTGDAGASTAGFLVYTNNGTFFTRGIVNCAGMAADRILEMFSEPTVRIVPTAGDYFVLDTKAAGQIRHVIFHEPEEKGKGLTLVPTVDGNILVGPTERPGDDFRTEAIGLEELRELVAQVIPTLPMEHVIRSFGAVRPNPQKLQITNYNLQITNKDEGTESEYVIDDMSISDFCIVESGDGACVSFVGVKTPGLTCANELGLYAAEKMAAFLGAADNPSFSPYRSPSVRLSDMSFEERELFLQKEGPASSRIICRCRGVSEGEIVDAIHRFPGATTLDGVKRRTGAGSGRCQGGFCAQRVIEILARELQCAPEDIMKDGENSYFFIRE